jgi:putative phosphoesterase
LKILVASDFHGKREAFENVAEQAMLECVDLIIICGDVTHFGEIKEAETLLASLADLKIPIYFVPGNCDPPELANMTIEGVMSLHGVCKTMNNWTFLGVGGSQMGPLHTPFEMTEKEILRILESGLKNCLVSQKIVLVSHVPPFQTKLDKVFYGDHVGSFSVRNFIIEKKPTVVFCGHIHEARGIDYIGETLLVNPGPVSHGYYGLVKLNEKVEVVLRVLNRK